MLTIITKPEEVQNTAGEIRAGGTDLHDRYHLGVSAGPIVDIYKLKSFNDGELGAITQAADDSTHIGALATIDQVARDPIVTQHYAGLAKAAAGLATPQIRSAASMGGALLQRTRCWFFRHPHYVCYKKGGDGCFARARHNPNGVIFDAGGCVYPHPSTLGMALLAYEAEVEVYGQGRRPIVALYGDGSDPTRDHLLAPNELLTYVHLPPPVANERTAYFRAIGRFEAEWPIVECMVRLVVEEGAITFARVGAGGVAAVPLRLANVEAELVGQPATQATIERASTVAAAGANPLPHTAPKVDFLVGALLHTLEQALD
ncbi:MAG: FAD binding domain-containing protein [Caldilineaceae bacterium]|nr:FAD binding domain-containing protein [Caldilineaceae bacterium]